MAVVGLYSGKLVVSSGEKAFVFSLKGELISTLEIPQVTPAAKTQNTTPKSKISEDDNTTEVKDMDKDAVLCLSFSPCGKWFGVCSASKQLCIWETEKWTLSCVRNMPRAASSLTFSPDSNSVVIVDKSGDALMYSMENMSSDGNIILGHLSMLLDVIISNDGNHIITCDRDEKIRVSQFPNAYNIVSYCLGHKEFVSSICLLPHNPSVLVSGSGDSTLCLWDFITGSLLVRYDCLQDLPGESMSEKNDSHTNEECVKEYAISKVRCEKIDANTSVASVIMHGVNVCLIYCLSDSKVSLISAVDLPQEPVDMCFRSCAELYVFTYSKDKPVVCLTRDPHSQKFLESSHDHLLSAMKVCNISEDISNSLGAVRNIPQLFKRKFDNVKDYMERKKARISTS